MMFGLPLASAVVFVIGGLDNCVVVSVEILVGVWRRNTVALRERLCAPRRWIDCERRGLIVRSSGHSMEIIGMWQSAVRGEAEVEQFN